jgi:His-Xaa-Ser system protein HxsD
MSDLVIDAAEGSVSFEIATAAYTEQSVQIAAHIFENRAEVMAGSDSDSIDVTLQAKGKLDAEGLRALGGEFLNELLNQEYRVLVTDFNKKVTGLIITQALFSARGGEVPPEQADETTPEFKKDVEKMLAEAREDIAKTMPKKIADRGIPMTLPKEEASG